MGTQGWSFLPERQQVMQLNSQDLMGLQIEVQATAGTCDARVAYGKEQSSMAGWYGQTFGLGSD